MRVIKENKELDQDHIDDLEEQNSLKRDRVLEKLDKSFNLARDGDSSNGSWDVENPAMADNTQLKQLFYTEAWVYILIDLLANKISSQRMSVFSESVTNGEKVEESAHDHPLNAVIDRPNQWQGYSSWMYQNVVELCTGGNSLNVWMKGTNQLIPLPHERVTLDVGEEGKGLKAYQYFPNGMDYENLHVNMSFKPEDIIHVRNPNPNSMLWGLSPLVPATKAIQFERYTTDYLLSFYQKQATPALALEMEDTVNQDVALRLLRTFEMAHTGRKNQRRTMLLPKGMKIKQLSHTINDQSMDETSARNLNTLINIWKVPKHELGMQKSGSLGSEEYKIALRNFWEATLIPLMDRLADEFTRSLSKELGDGFKFGWDLSEVHALQEDLTEKAVTATAMLQAGLSLNEVRQRVWKEEPIENENANIPFVLVNQSTPQVPQFFSEAPSNAKAANEPEEKKDETPEDGKADKIISQQRQQQSNFINKHKSAVSKHDSIIQKQLDIKSTDIQKLALTLMKETAIEAIKVVRSTVRDSKSKLKSEIPSESVLRAKLAAAFDRLGAKYESEAREALVESVEAGYDSQLVFSINETSENEIEGLRERDADVRRRRLISTVHGRTEKITDTNTRQIMDLIKDAVADGDTVAEIAGAIRDKFSDFEFIGNRSKTIARTETLTAVSLGQQAAIENVSEVLPDIKKMWINANDARVRGRSGGLYEKAKADHWDLGGQMVDPKAKFSDPKNGHSLKMPRDPEGGPEDVINCRCTLVLVEPEDVEEAQQILEDQEQ